MSRVARQAVEQAGIDVNVLIDKLVREASRARGLVLRVLSEGRSGHFPARRARLFALREPLHDRRTSSNLPFYKAGRVDEIPSGHIEFRCLEGQPPGSSALGGPVLRARRRMPASQNPLEGAGLWDHLLDCPWHHF
jgi:hypothetical protein